MVQINQSKHKYISVIPTKNMKLTTLRKFCKRTFLLSFFLLSSFAFSQITLSGKVVDSKTANIIVDPLIVVTQSDKEVKVDPSGNFSVSLPSGSYTLEVYAEGYNDQIQNLELNQDTSVSIQLVPKEEKSEQAKSSDLRISDIVLTKKTKKVDIASPQMGINKLDGAQIKEMPAVLGESDVIKSLTMLPGVTTGGESSGGFNVRGGAEDQNQVMQDNAMLYNTTHLFGFFSVFHPDAVESLDLYKGSIPARYGGRIASVLDVRLKEGNQDSLRVMGGIGTVSSRIMAEGPIQKGKSSFMVAGRSSYAHLFLPLFDNPNSARFSDLTLKTDFDLSPKDHLSVNSYLSRDVFLFEESISNNYGNIVLGTNWQRKISPNLTSNAHLSYTKFFYNLELDFLGLEFNSNMSHLKADLGFRHKISPNFSLDYGLGATYYDENPGTLNPFGSNSQVVPEQFQHKLGLESALYLSAEHKVDPKLNISYGLRYSMFQRLGPFTTLDYINGPIGVGPDGKYIKGAYKGELSYGNGEVLASFDGLEPRFGLSYQFNENNSLKAAYNKSTQYIHLISNTTSSTPLDIWELSNPFVQPQRADQISLGYFSNLDKGMYSLEIESYYKRTKNRLDYIDGAQLIAEKYIEQQILPGIARSYGIEFLFRKNRGDLTGWIAYTLSRAEQKSYNLGLGDLGVGEGVYYTSNQDRTHDLTLTGMYKLNDRWRFATNFVYQTGKPFSLVNSAYYFEGIYAGNFGQRNDSRIPDYHRLDLSATYTPPGNRPTKWLHLDSYKKEWVFSIYNVYNRHNYTSINFNQNEDTLQPQIVGTYIFGIVPSVTFNFEF
ncbi:MAG: hypothetical protein C4K58_00235 [Flavobacteriaceae bacterium]|nr:MAG: hypothetical protein C4K58_00235 [Flavobacteriaceae bacterium]